MRAFFAYQAQPVMLAETIESAIEEINSSNLIQLRGWKLANINGSYIIDEILREVNNSELFACDLTALNPNVLFELGYAIALEKRRWITLNPTIRNSKQNYGRFMLSTLGYSAYSTSAELTQRFYEDHIWESNSPSLLVAANSLQTKRSILYLRSSINSEATSRLYSAIEATKLPVVTDNPKETTIQPLNWYIEHSMNAFGVVIELIGDNREATLHFNAKQSLIAGIVHGLNIPLLMLVDEPFNSPIDYRDLLKQYTTANECIEIFHDWVTPIKDRHFQNVESYQEHLRQKRSLNELGNLFVGEHIAENESDTLPEYFLPTQAYREALNSQHSLFVGRKGSGKTANFIALKNDLSRDKRNFVCTIQPYSYDVDGVLSVIKDVEQKLRELPNGECMEVSNTHRIG